MDIYIGDNVPEVVIKFRYNNTDTNFYDTEIPEIVVSNVQKADTWQDLQGYYHICKTRDSYKKITVTFITKSYEDETTWDKLNIIWGYKDTYYQPTVIQCFYEYLISTTSNCYVQMKRDDYKLKYFCGKPLAEEKIRLVFYEAVPEGAAIVSNQIIGS